MQLLSLKYERSAVYTLFKLLFASDCLDLDPNLMKLGIAIAASMPMQHNIARPPAPRTMSNTAAVDFFCGAPCGEFMGAA